MDSNSLLLKIMSVHEFHESFLIGNATEPKLVDEKDKLVGLGIAEYGADKAKERIGQKNQKPLVHYDYLYLQG